MSSHRGEQVDRRSWDLGSHGVRALAAVTVVVAIGAALVAWRARPDVEPLVVGSPASMAPGVSAGTVVVAVSGKVRDPGLVQLPAGARVADAIEAAGGAIPGTDLSMINLARKLVDGELIVVGVAQASGSNPAGPGGGSGLVNVNTATVEQLQALPGVGPVLAQRIVDYREQHGGFTNVADLRKVSGIGDARYNDIKARVTV